MKGKQFNTRSRINKKKVVSQRNITATYKLGGINPPRDNWRERYVSHLVAGNYVTCISNSVCEDWGDIVFTRDKQYEIISKDDCNVTLKDDNGKKRVIPIESFAKAFEETN